MRVEELIDAIGADFYTGVPDSQLKTLCDYLITRYGTDPQHHIIAANEGNAAALAAGYHLATGKIPVVYLQNSGEGNIINPLASLLSRDVYAIPAVFIIGWRGEPGVHDEPQHIYQGKVTRKLLEDMDIPAFTISSDTTPEQLRAAMTRFRALLAEGVQVAFVVRKNALTGDGPCRYQNDHTLLREDAIRQVVQAAGDDILVSTTGKASRELFEIRMANGQDHRHDFLTVGSMGHCSSIALGIALQQPGKRVWCLDGDGAALMHMGSMAVIGTTGADNLIHVVFNNGAHESVGGMPTAAGKLRLSDVAHACGYPRALWAESGETLAQALARCRDGRELSFLEICCAIGSRPDLGRPTVSPQDNKRDFMVFLAERDE